MDDDFTPQDYRLQYRRGNSSQYEDAYIGKDNEFLVLHLDPHTDHLFRVCARGEGRTEWSPWSIPQTGYTTLAPHGTNLALQTLFILILSVLKGQFIYSPSCHLDLYDFLSSDKHKRKLSLYNAIEPLPLGWRLKSDTQ